MTPILLAVDAGGTKCELAVLAGGEDRLRFVARKRYLSSHYARLEDIIAEFLAESGVQPSHACLGIAGVVSGGFASVTNLPWSLSEQDIAGEFGMDGVWLINDLTSVCASISLLESHELLEIQTGEVQPDQPIGVLAPGTGLGEGLLLEGENIFFPRGSEGGHADFAPVNDEQAELLKWMLRRYDHVSYESLIAGPGVPHLYDFYKEHLGLKASPDVSKMLDAVQDRTPVIFDGAFADNPCPLCRRTVDLFLAILGAEAGNLALKLYARGGIYIGGGILPRIAGKASFDGFLANFGAKGKMADLMKTIPVHIILNPDAALLGAIRYGRKMISR